MTTLLIRTKAPKYLQSFFYLISIVMLFAPGGKLIAQDTSVRTKKILSRLTLAGGLGLGVPEQRGNYGFGSYVEFAIQKRESLYAIGVRELIEFDIFSTSNVQNKVGSVDLTYGKAYTKGNFYASLNAGFGYTTVVVKGSLISRQGGWLFSHSIYEKLSANTIGIPISCKIMWLPAKFYGIGLELYANLNGVNSFYGFNMAHQFGKLRPVMK